MSKQRKWGIIALIFSMLTCFQQAKSQNIVLDSVNLQLRQFFSPLTRPFQPKWFLYDMAAHVTDSIWFSTGRHDTADTDIWFKVYQEMYASAYDTLPLQIPDTLFEKGNSYLNDTIPIGIMHYSFYKLKEDAMTTDNYFLFDTVNNILSDNPLATSSAYLDSAMFLISPLKSGNFFTNPVFRIDPQFMLRDEFNEIYYNTLEEGLYELKIDFDDSNGWITFDQTTVTNYQVTYKDSGNYVIRVAIFPTGNPNPIFVSAGRFNIASPVATIPPDEYIDLPGIRGGYYAACNSTGKTGKTVIYVEGIDLLDFIPGANRGINKIYEEMIQREDIVELRNQGYNFVVVDWKNSRIDLRFNALYLVNLIEHLKCDMTDDEQFVVIGESMGGLVTRFALKYMETDEYHANDVSPFFVDEWDENNIVYLLTHPEIYDLLSWERCHRDKMHNSRLMITLDAPHQGANIPISVQKLYRHVMNVFGPFISLALKSVTNAFNIMLDGQAAQQMLINHIDTEYGSGFYKQYTSHEDKNDFFEQLNAMGNYPIYAKSVLMSNGSLRGQGQRNYHEEAGGAERTPGDRLLDFNLDTYLRILWFKIPMFGGDLDVRTNFNGNGKILQANAGKWSIRIKLKWFGIKISTGYNSLLYVEDYANTRPYCTSAGGYFNAPKTPFGQSAQTISEFNLSNNYWLLNLFHYNLRFDGAGCLLFDSHAGLNGFASANLDWGLCSDGMHFNFIPTASALDFGNVQTQALDLDIANDFTVDEKFAMTPADVIIGYVDDEGNRSHLDYRNDRIYNLRGGPTAYPNYYTFFSCENQGKFPQRSMLSLEIGDEELYLENVELPWFAKYSAEYDILINRRNPYYEYSGGLVASIGLLNGGAYSRADPFIMTGSGSADFHYDGGGTPTGLGFVYDSPQTGSWGQSDGPQYVCCEKLSTRARTLPVKPLFVFPSLPATHASSLTVYPNPNNGRTATMKMSLKTPGKAIMELWGMNGQRIFQQFITIQEGGKETYYHLDMNKLNLVNGLYMVRVTNGKEVLTSKLLISK